MLENLKKYDLYLYMLVAYLFSIACRYIWVYQFSGYDNFYWNDQLMINTNDGYYFATVVKDMLLGSNPDNQLLSVALDTYPGTIYSIYYAAKILPFSLDTIILYAPSVVSSLIVIPIILIGRAYKLTFVGFLSALLASITWSFYNRTMVGYFDTDMYALVFPVFILYFLMKFLKDNSLQDTLIASLITALYVVFYPQGYAAITALFIMFIVYGLVFIKEKRAFYFSIALMSIALIKIALFAKVAIIIFIFFATKQELLSKEKNPLYFAIFFVLLFIIMGDGYELILSKISWYTKTGVEGKTLQFYDVAQTIREAGKIPFETFANRISGSIFAFLIGVIGYILLVIKKREFLLFLPLIAIGFFAYIGGLRFTVYAIPAMALGTVYFIYFLATQFIKEKKLQYLAMVAGAILFIYPNIQHIISYKVPTVLNKQEVDDLTKLKNISSVKDYTLSWWDYGYPIWYYSNTNTLIDGGKHHHDNFIISKILLSDSQKQSATLARVAVEKYVAKELAYSPVSTYVFEKDGKILNPNRVLNEMKRDNYPLPKKTRDIYLYLPFRMMNIFPTIALFSNLNLKTGQPTRQMMFYPSSPLGEKNGQVVMRNGIVFDTLKGLVKIGSKTAKVQNFDIVTLGRDSIPNVQSELAHLDGQVSVVYLKNYGKIIVMDNQTYHSTYVQMFMLGKYDKNLFELVISSPYSKIFKVKI